MEKRLIIPLYKPIAMPHLEYCKQTWRPYHKKDIDKLERVQRRATKLISELKNVYYERRLLECGLKTVETRRLKGDQTEVFKMLNRNEDIDGNIVFKLKADRTTRGHKAALVKAYCRLDINYLFIHLFDLIYYYNESTVIYILCNLYFTYVFLETTNLQLNRIIIIIMLSVAKRQRLLPSLDSCSPFVSLL